MVGEVHLVTGCMFAGKTTRILNTARQLNPRDVLIVKHAIDTRYVASDHACTHDGVTMPCARLSCLREVFSIPRFKDVGHVMVDEGQFFEDLCEVVTEMAERHGKVVTIAALASDYRREPFQQVAKVACIADTIEWLYAECAHCGERAMFNKKKDVANPMIVGGSDLYAPVCRRHFHQSKIT